MLNVLFVCLGNICRSPLAEAIFDHQIKELGLDKYFKTDSCGTGGYHVGATPDHRSIEVAEKHGIIINHRARKFIKEDYNNFDYILPMDEQNKKYIMQTTGYQHDGLFLMRDFDTLPMSSKDVPDPYYGGKDGFMEVYEMLVRSNLNFINFLKDKHKLS